MSIEDKRRQRIAVHEGVNPRDFWMRRLVVEGEENAVNRVLDEDLVPMALYPWHWICPLKEERRVRDGKDGDGESGLKLFGDNPDGLHVVMRVKSDYVARRRAETPDKAFKA